MRPEIWREAEIYGFQSIQNKCKTGSLTDSNQGGRGYQRDGQKGNHSLEPVRTGRKGGDLKGRGREIKAFLPAGIK